jgi:hypothetical protein
LLKKSPDELDGFSEDLEISPMQYDFPKRDEERKKKKN